MERDVYTISTFLFQSISTITDTSLIWMQYKCTQYIIVFAFLSIAMIHIFMET